MKKTVIILIYLLTILSVTVMSQPIDDMTEVAENRYLILHLNEEDASFAVEIKETGDVWFSNPPDFRDYEEILRGETLERLASQLVINYDPNDIYRDNYNYSIEDGQFSIEEINQGVKIDFEIVEHWDITDYIPQLAQKEPLEEMLEQIEDDDDREFVRDQYRLIGLKKIEEGAERKISVEAVDLDELFGDYELVEYDEDLTEKDLSESDRRELVWKILEKIRNTRHDVERTREVSSEMLIPLKDTPTYIFTEIPPFFEDDVGEILRGAGIEPDFEIEEMHITYRINSPQLDLEYFRVPIEYYLEGEDLVTNIPAEEIEFPDQVTDIMGEEYTFPLLNIQLLPNFGLATREDEGYIFVPDGSGALINLNNKKEDNRIFRADIYGRDRTLFPREQESVAATESYPDQVRLPIFGLKKNNQAFLAIIEEGAALGRIRAGVAGQNNSYNFVFPEFTTIPKGRQDLGDAAQINLYTTDLYRENIKVRYSFLSDSEANYSGMARRYRDYLEKNYDYDQLHSRDETPFYLDLIGAISRREPYWGLPQEVTKPLTTYNQVKEISQFLKSEEINNVQIRYRGWLKGGMYHEYPNKVRREKLLGTETEFEELIDYFNQSEMDLYLEVGFLRVYRNRLLSEFSPNTHAAQRLNFERAQDEGRYVLCPSALEKLVNDFIDDYQEYEIEGLALTEIGQMLNSAPRYSDQRIDREQAREMVEKQLANIQKTVGFPLIERGHSYVLPYIKNLINVPFTSSDYNIVDENIPFYQMVLQGYIDYSGPPVNLSDQESEELLLKHIDYASYPYFVLSYGDDYQVRNSEFNHFLSIGYESWIDEAVEFYKKVDEVLSEVYDKRIISREEIKEEVYRTDYENDKTIIVNYNEKEVDIEGITIGSRDYKLLERGDGIE